MIVWVVGFLIILVLLACYCFPRFLDWLKNVKGGIVWFFRNVYTLSSHEFTNSISTQIDEKIRVLENRTDEIEKMARACDVLLEEISELNRRIDDYDLSVKGIVDKMVEFRKDVLELDKKVGTYDTSFQGITDQTTKLKDEISELRKKIDEYSEIKAVYERRILAFEKASRRRESTFENRDVTESGARRVFTINGVEFAFRYCSAGTFTMGSPANEAGRDDNEFQRSARIKEGFWICEFPTTQALWDAVGVKKTKGCGFEGAKRPVENVTWFECSAFVKKLNELCIAPKGWRFALATEDQWEYACRAGTTCSTYNVSLDEVAWYEKNSGSQTHEVGTKKANNWGISDMLGNVWEWTGSNYKDGRSFVSRGGSWSSGAHYCRSAKRGYYAPAYCNVNLGFRCVLVRG